MSDDEAARRNDGAAERHEEAEPHHEEATRGHDEAPRGDEEAEQCNEAAERPDEEAARGHDEPPRGDEEATHRHEEGAGRHDGLSRHATQGPRNSLRHWPDAKHPLRVAINYAVIVLCRISPSLRLKNWLLRRLGVTVGEGAAWGLESTPDVFWPELITVEADAIVGYDATILCHEFLQDEYRTGEVVVGERAMIGAGAIVLPGVEIGADAQVAANSLVAEDVPAGATVAGVPAEPTRAPAGEVESDAEDGAESDARDETD